MVVQLIDVQYLRAICRNSSSRNIVNGRTDLLTGSAGGKMLFAFDFSALLTRHTQLWLEQYQAVVFNYFYIFQQKATNIDFIACIL